MKRSRLPGTREIMTNLHIYPSNFTHESRILKETRSLTNLGLVEEVLIVGLWDDGLPEREILDAKRQLWRVRLSSKRLPKFFLTEVLKYLELTWKTLFGVRHRSVTYVNCHSLAVLPIGFLFKILRGSKLIYDAHELETERLGLSGIRQRFSRRVERTLVRSVDRIIVVSDSIAAWYKREYPGKKVHVIRNVPTQESFDDFRSNVLRERFEIGDEELLFIYQGVVAKGRGIRLLLEIFAQVERTKHLVIMGYGNLESLVQEHEANHPNIHFQPAVKPDEILRYTSSADVGISLIENSCLSYYYSLPNKIFEYLLCGLPLIVSDFPDMGSIVDRYACGWKVLVERSEVLKLIQTIDPHEVEERKQRVLKCRDEFGWHHEEQEYFAVYQRPCLLGAPASPPAS